MKKLIFALAAAAWLTAFTAPAFAGETRITWHGHAAFEITTPSGHVFWIDPWLNNPKNPNAGEGKDPVAQVQRADYILLTHGHFDHAADVTALAKRTGAKLVASFELGSNLVKLQGFPAEQAGFDTLMNPGGELTLAGGEVKVRMTPAIHSSSVQNPNAGPNDPDMVYGGQPGGFILTIEDGPTIYHTGDTDFFKELYSLRHCGCVTVALANTGGHFGMEPDVAAYAVRAIGAKYAVAHHYGTFPVLAQDTSVFQQALKEGGGWKFWKKDPEYVHMEPGDTIAFDGDELKK